MKLTRAKSESVAGAYLKSACKWARLARGRRLIRPSADVGLPIRFADGTTSRIFRETRLTGPVPDDPVILVIRFRLAFLGDVPVLHAGFRRESLIHTPLFAGFPGFSSKLWLEDRDTRIYRGLYEWNGERSASSYARCMVGLLEPFSNRGTCDFHVVPGLGRYEFLRGLPPAAGTTTAWWRVVSTGADISP